MDHELVLENYCSAAAVNTLSNTIIYLKTEKYLNIRLTDLLNQPETQDRGVKDSGSNTAQWL